MSNVDSATVSTVREVDTCGDSTSTENGTPVITANVVIEGNTELPTTLQPTHVPGTTPSTTTVGGTQSTAESSATTTKAVLVTSMATTHSKPTTVSTETTTTTTSKSTQTRLSTTEFTEPSAPETTAGNDIRATTDFENVTTTTWLLISANTEREKAESGLIASILIPTIVVLLVSGIVVATLCLILGRCASIRLHKHRRHDLRSLSVKAPNGLNGSHDLTDSHIYCEVLAVKKRDFTESYSDLDHSTAFKDLDCSCKIPHRYPSVAADYEVPITTLQRSGMKLRQSSQGLKEDYENTYETPIDAKKRLQGESVDTDGERKVLESTYDTPRLVEEEYMFMASPTKESKLSISSDTGNIYENVIKH